MMVNTSTVRDKYFGKYRGKVVNNIDPLFMGRLLVEVVLTDTVVSTWAMPCVPYAGPEVGFYAMPPLDGNIWVEFEGGDPNFPIWVGCFWDEGEIPPVVYEDIEDTSLIKVLQTDFNTFMFNDMPEEGGMALMSYSLCVPDPCTMVFDDAGIQIAIPESSITMTVDTITVTSGDIAVTATEAIQTTAGTDIAETAGGAIEITAGDDLAATAGAAIEVTASADIAVEAGAAIEVMAAGDTSVNAGGAVEITAGGAIAADAGGACEITSSDVAITSVATEITSAAIAMTGAVEVTGDLLIDGLQPVVV